MSEDSQDKLCEGYLITGEQKTVEGGFTVDFQKRNKYYFVLWKTGEHIYNLEGFADEKAFKGKRSSSFSVFGTLRKKSVGSNSIPSYILTSTVKIHCMDMTIGRKKNHVIILVHARIPYYFKTMKEQEIKPWYKALNSVAIDMESRNTERKPSDDVILRKSPPKISNHASVDSGRGSNCSSLRSSQGSSDSRLSDLVSSCPPSPSFIPTNIMIEIGPQDDHGVDGEDEHDSPVSSGLKARRQLTRSVIYRKRQRRDSCSEQSGVVNFTEAPPQTYDLVIRKSVVIGDADDLDYDLLPPQLPQKTRTRRGSEPNLLMPSPHHHHRHHQAHDQRRSPKNQRPSTQVVGDSPPPLPARPLTQAPIHPTPFYMNVGRKQSLPATLSLMSPLSPPGLDQTYEQPERAQEDIGRLQWEQSKEMDGVLIEFSKAELLDSLVLTTINKEVWVAGWKKDLESQLYGRLHVGDKLRQINTQVVSSADLAMEFIRSTAQDKITVTLSRLPHAQLLNLNRSDCSIQWGVHLKSNNEIKSLSDGPAITEGLTTKAKCVFSAKACDWVITEINHRRVPLAKSGKNQDLVKTELDQDHRELPLVIHPHDFIKKLSEAVQKRPNSQFS